MTIGVIGTVATASVGQNIIITTAATYTWYRSSGSIRAGAYTLTKTATSAYTKIYFYNGNTVVYTIDQNMASGTQFNVTQDCTAIWWASDTAGATFTFTYNGAIFSPTSVSGGSVTQITTTQSITLTSRTQVVCLGGGGGGGPGGTWPSTYDSAGGSGGSGYINIGFVEAGTYTATIGAGGTGTTISSNSGGTSTSGGTTSLGGVSAAGGGGGGGGSTNSYNDGGNGSGGSTTSGRNTTIGINGSPGSGVAINGTWYAPFSITPGSGAGQLYCAGSYNSGNATGRGGGGGGGNAGNNIPGSGNGFAGSIWYRSVT